uniref:Uncharacterized protein n=1 Tax=Piliocolobus tephrosceles TaxID=591936 RepID=A0A8C9INH3_9PRIM
MQELLLQYRIVPIFQAHHSCSLSLQDLHQACIPSPCRDNDHLGMHKKATQTKKTHKTYSLMLNKIVSLKK